MLIGRSANVSLHFAAFGPASSTGFTAGDTPPDQPTFSSRGELVKTVCSTSESQAPLSRLAEVGSTFIVLPLTAEWQAASSTEAEVLNQSLALLASSALASIYARHNCMLGCNAAIDFCWINRPCHRILRSSEKRRAHR